MATNQIVTAVPSLPRVLQGSNLEPLLFSILLNNLSQDLTYNILFFADDLEVQKLIKTMEDCAELQDM